MSVVEVLLLGIFVMQVHDYISKATGKYYILLGYSWLAVTIIQVMKIQYGWGL